MFPIKSIVAFAFAAGMSAMTSGCSTGVAMATPLSSTTGDSIPGIANSEVLPPLTKPVTFRNSSLKLTQPQSLAIPNVSATEADASCADVAADCPRGRQGVIRLAVATAAEGTLMSDGTVKPTLSDTLVFVQAWTSVPCARIGMPDPAGASGVKQEECAVIRLVDAHTGKAYWTTTTNDPSATEAIAQVTAR